jgi:hypothetical protein
LLCDELWQKVWRRRGGRVKGAVLTQTTIRVGEYSVTQGAFDFVPRAFGHTRTGCAHFVAKFAGFWSHRHPLGMIKERAPPDWNKEKYVQPHNRGERRSDPSRELEHRSSVSTLHRGARAIFRRTIFALCTAVIAMRIRRTPHSGGVQSSAQLLP